PKGDDAAVTNPSQMPPDGGPGSILDAGELDAGRQLEHDAGDAQAPLELDAGELDAGRQLEHDAGAGDAGDPRWALDAAFTTDAGQVFHVCRDRCRHSRWQCPNGQGGYSCSAQPACYCPGPPP